ncbi:MAG: hypothetical protein GXO74_09890 [Calditrichaeota bacterium]|nr:hypothetical protein [Calditrichota bacterium]
MERFLRFKNEVDLSTLQQAVQNPGIVVLRKSQITDTIQVRVPEGMSNKELKKLFGPFEITKVYNEFPYPIQESGFSRFLPWPISRLLVR